MNKSEKIKNIERWAILKYKLSGKKSMNTYIFTNAKKENLTDKEIDKLLQEIKKDLQKIEDEKIKESLPTINGVAI